MNLLGSAPHTCRSLVLWWPISDGHANLTGFDQSNNSKKAVNCMQIGTLKGSRPCPFVYFSFPCTLCFCAADSLDWRDSVSLSSRFFVFFRSMGPVIPKTLKNGSGLILHGTHDEGVTTKHNFSARCQYNVTGWVSMWAYDMLSQ